MIVNHFLNNKCRADVQHQGDVLHLDPGGGDLGALENTDTHLKGSQFLPKGSLNQAWKPLNQRRKLKLWRKNLKIRTLKKALKRALKKAQM